MILQHIIELCQMAHPKVNATLATKLINAGTLQFAKDSYCTGNNRSSMSLSGVTLDGSSASSPVTLLGSDGVDLLVYHDDTTDTATILPNSNLLYIIDFIQRDNLGRRLNVVTFDVQADKTIFVYDQYGNPISEFPSDLVTLEMLFAKTLAEYVVTTLDDASQLGSDEYDLAVSDWVVGKLYANRGDMDVVQRMQMERHHMNRYNVEMNKARAYFRKNHLLASVSGQVGPEFSL